MLHLLCNIVNKKGLLTKIFYLCLLLLFVTNINESIGQITVSGVVYDTTKTIGVKNVTVKSTSGNSVITDSLGKFSIQTFLTDSLLFIYNNKPTLKYAVKQIENTDNFDISIHVRVYEKFKTLKEVQIFTKSYRQDSAENRQRFATIFNYKKPGVSTSFDATTGAAGLDINELINIFRFKRNKQLKKMQERLEEEEKDRYINYRFNKATVRRITKLDGADLEIFMKNYRPDFEFTQSSSLVDFYQYILNASYHYKREKLIKSRPTK
jgi:hypothetical protein